MAALLVVIAMHTPICFCIKCYNSGVSAGNGRYCYCRPGTDGEHCEKAARDWSSGKRTYQSTSYRSWSTAGYAVDRIYVRPSITTVERYPWWKIDLGRKLKIGDVQAIPFITSKWGFDKIPMTWRAMVGVTSTGRYKLCYDDDERQDCKGAVGYLVVIVKRGSTSELAYLGLREVVVYAEPSSPSPCLSNPCGNGGTCEPKDTYYHRCICPETWPGRNCAGKNWARGQNATISGTNGTVIAASNTVDGNRDDVMRHGNNIDNQCVTTTSDVTSPWWKVELGIMIEVIQVYMVTRVESRNTDLLHCDIYIGPYNDKYTKHYDHSRDNNTKNTSSGDEIYRWFYVWCLPVSIGNTVEIKYNYQLTPFESSFYAILSLCEVEVYGRIKLCASNPCNNGGTCNSNDTLYVCFCPAAWNGTNCENKITKLRKEEIEGIPVSTKVLVGVGAVGVLVAIGAGAAAVAGWTSAGAMAHSGDISAKLGGVTASKAVRSGLVDNFLAIFGDEEDDGDEDGEEYSLWDSVCRSVTSFVEEISDAINSDLSDTAAADQQSG